MAFPIHLFMIRHACVYALVNTETICVRFQALDVAHEFRTYVRHPELARERGQRIPAAEAFCDGLGSMDRQGNRTYSTTKANV